MIQNFSDPLALYGVRDSFSIVYFFQVTLHKQSYDNDQAGPTLIFLN